METAEVSQHLVRVFQAISKADGWVTARDIAQVSNVAERTSRAHLTKLVKAGIVDQAEVFPAHRYKLSALAEKRNRTFMQRLNQAIAIFG